MERRCERCLRTLPTDHVGDMLCSPCRREAVVRDGIQAARPMVRPSAPLSPTATAARPA